MKNAGIPTRYIDQSSVIPFYYQLQEILKEEIEQGRWKSGELLPSESELTQTYGVSRTVIRKSLDILEGDGQVVRIKGKGTIVARPKFEYEALEWPQATATRRGQLPASLAKVIEVRTVAAGSPVGKLFDLDPLEVVFQLHFLHSIREVPTSLSQMLLRTDASPALAALAAEGQVPMLREGGSEAVSQLTDQYDLGITESQLTIEATVVSDFESDLLRIGSGAPVFLLTTIDLNDDGAAIAFTRTIARSDQFRFSATVRRVRESSPEEPVRSDSFTQKPQ